MTNLRELVTILQIQGCKETIPEQVQENLNLCLEIAQVNGAAESIKNTGWSMKFMTAK